MSNLQKSVPVKDLRPGMFVGDVFNENGILLFSSNSIITGYHQIEQLKRQGVTVVTIISKNEDRTTPSLLENNKTTVDTGEPYLQFQKQVRHAYTIRRNTIDAVRSMMMAARAGRFFSVNSLVQTLQSLMVQVVENPDVIIGVSQIKDFDEHIYAHSVNVSVLMIGLASILGYSKESTLEAGIAGMLHDIGMVRFSEELVRKNGLRTRQEVEELKKHPAYGIEILQRLSKELPASVFHVIAQHHERINGSGYPQFLKGDQIQEMSMLCAIADVYDKLTTSGALHRACLPQEALALIFQGADEEYPRRLVEHFTKLLGIYPVGSFVKLESGEMGLVVKVNRSHLLSPQLVMLFDNGGRRIEERYIRDLSKWNKESDRDLWKITCSLDPLNFGINPAEIICDQIESY